jgi:predicted benzoate:H+ symporter BenE
VVFVRGALLRFDQLIYFVPMAAISGLCAGVLLCIILRPPLRVSRESV